MAQNTGGFWQKLGNALSGNGFKTDAQVATDRKAEEAAHAEAKAQWEGAHPGQSYASHVGSVLGAEMGIMPMAGFSIEAANGSIVAGFTKHGINRAIGDAAERAGTKPEAILDALKNPQKIVSGVDAQGRPFQIFTGQNARVVMNPQTGNIVSVNPLSAAGAQ